MDKWCQENCNPENVPLLSGVNTQVCEQLFKKVNSHRNCKSFNEARFFMFFLYQFDIHNLSIEGLETKMADPREEFRWQNIDIMDPVLEERPDEDLSSVFEKMKIAKFECEQCGSGYSQEGYLKKHLETKHGLTEKSGPECKDCGKVFANTKTLAKHIKSHLKCNICKKEFLTPEEAADHKKDHTVCKLCNKDFYFASKLTKHVNSIHKDV